MSNSLTALTNNPHPLLTVAEVREVERTAQAGLPAGTLMERAAEAAARRALQLSAEHGGPIWLLAGPGNNGGDALVTACLLRTAGVAIQVALLAGENLYQGDAAQAWQRWAGPVRHELDDGTDGKGGLDRASLIIDGLFGIGLNRPLTEKTIEWIRRINLCRAKGIPVLALDVPSGLDADTGSIQGHQHSAVQASHTLTFLADKPGLHTRAGVDHAGEIEVATLGIPLHGSYCGGLNNPEEFIQPADPPRARPRDSHKGSFGSVGIIGGSDGMIGAGLLAGRSALLSGAGRVYLRLLSEHAPACDPLHAELMLRKQLDDITLDVALIGPGLGQDRKARVVLSALLDPASVHTPDRLVLDADALTLIGKDATLRERLVIRNHQEGRVCSVCILTPHPGEAASLLAGTPMAGDHSATVQDARIATALHLAQTHHAIVVLKGAGTIIARPDGLWRINPTGNPGLASGGTGDVLGGLISALLAQHWPAWHAALAAVWLHGAAADHCVAQGEGPIGLTASELLLPIRSLLNQLLQHSPQRRAARVASPPRAPRVTAEI